MLRGLGWTAEFESGTLLVTRFWALPAPNLAYYRLTDLVRALGQTVPALLPGPRRHRLVCRNKEEAMSRRSDLDNHADQLNPNNDAYWQSRGDDERPDDWEEKASDEDRAKQEDAQGPNNSK